MIASDAVRFFALVVCMSAPPSVGAQSMVLTDLKVDYTVAPINIDNPAPTFSWVITATSPATARNVQQVAYELAVGNSTSGKVSSNSSTFVKLPAGLTLTSNTDYSWNVKVYLQDGTSITAASAFSTGLIHQSDWAGSEWITPASNLTSGQMRKTFEVKGTPTHARMYLAIPGYAAVSINGQRVDPVPGTRSWSQYDIRALYHTYDVKDHIVSGTNTIGILVGAGWYTMWGYGTPTARMVLLTTIGAENVVRVVTDASWMYTPGPVLVNSEYNGETYDARLETPGWDTSAYSPAAPLWQPVLVGSKYLNATLMTSAAFPVIKVVEERTAKYVTEPSPGVYVFDFEQNLAGWVRFKINGPRGQRIQFRHAELLMHEPYGPRDGNIYVGNLRGAKATDVYYLKGDPEGETFEPILTQHGFRYVEVTGLLEPPTVEQIKAIFIRSSVEQTGTVAFSDDMLNKVQHNLLYGQATNLMMVPTDCDQRDERLGWTGDSALTSEEALMNYDMGAFYHNWAQMLEDTSPNGGLGCTVPNHPGKGNVPAAGSCDASWTSVYPSVVWGLLKYYGDTTVEKYYDGVVRFITNEYNRTLAPTGIKNMFANFGDWVPPPPAAKVDKAFTAGYSFLNDVRNMIELATKLGHADDAARFATWFKDIGADFHTAWFDEQAGYYADGGQTAQVLALHLDIVPAALKEKVVGHLATLVRDTGENHTSCGIIGWRWEPEVLSAIGYGDLAYAIMTQQTYPSFGYEILNEVEPATTVWELWDSDKEGPGMNSRDHIMFGGPGVWLYNYVGGISQTADSIGFEHVLFSVPEDLAMAGMTSPGVVPNNATISAPLEWTTVSKQTPRGTFQFQWSVRQPTSSSTCGIVSESEKLDLSCDNGATITAVTFDSYGNPTGDCAQGFKYGTCNSNATMKIAHDLCVGKQSCSLTCSQTTCNGVTVADPCYGTPKKLAASVTCSGGPNINTILTVESVVPSNTLGSTVIPLMGKSTITITENATATVWDGSKYVPGVNGVTGATQGVSPQGTPAIVVTHTSGTYLFTVSG
eukprot:m.512916 g.512916  ORF g.512916 m.512916 type:complete len:1042 (+) comp21898_c0_seq1:116-3241(+)